MAIFQTAAVELTDADATVENVLRYIRTGHQAGYTLEPEDWDLECSGDPAIIDRVVLRFTLTPATKEAN